MCRLVNKKSLILFILSILLVFTTINAQSQEEESSDNQPSYINELVDNSQLTQSQVTQMRNNGESWGNIKLRVQMAERIAANNPDTGTVYEQRYQDALNQISQQRATGKGFGDIANENNFKVGDVIGNGNGNAVQNQQRNRAMSENQNQEQVQTRQQTQTQAQVQTQKKGLLGRFFGIFGIGKKEKKQESAQTKNALKNEKTQENANKKQTQESSGKSQTKGSQNKVQTQQNTSNQVQNRNSSSSQNVRTQERTQTNQRNRTQSGNSGSGNTFRNQGFGGGAGRTGSGGGRGR